MLILENSMSHFELKAPSLFFYLYYFSFVLIPNINESVLLNRERKKNSFYFFFLLISDMNT